MTTTPSPIPNWWWMAPLVRASAPIFQHLLDTYASETNKVASLWSSFAPEDLAYRIHPRSGTVKDVLKHQLLSERRFFAEFLGFPEPPPAKTIATERPSIGGMAGNDRPGNAT